jgi:hypothetical protein
MEIRIKFITLMMEAVDTSETSVYSNETIWRYIREGSKLYTRRRENLKSHKFSSLPYNFTSLVQRISSVSCSQRPSIVTFR